MTTEADARQEAEWAVLHDRITQALRSFGNEDPFGDGDYWLLDDNWGWSVHQLEVQNLAMLRHEVILALQTALVGYPDWYVTVRVAVPGTQGVWPGMGVVVYPDEIVDELQRQYFPAEFQDIRY